MKPMLAKDGKGREIPDGAKQGLEFVWCERVDDSLNGALEEERVAVAAE